VVILIGEDRRDERRGGMRGDEGRKGEMRRDEGR
jgi:hypothetical protein